MRSKVFFFRRSEVSKILPKFVQEVETSIRESKVAKSIISKQWPLAPNSREWRITRANVSRRVTFFSKMAFGKCRRVCRIRQIRCRVAIA